MAPHAWRSRPRRAMRPHAGRAAAARRRSRPPRSRAPTTAAGDWPRSWSRSFIACETIPAASASDGFVASSPPVSAKSSMSRRSASSRISSRLTRWRAAWAGTRCRCRVRKRARRRNTAPRRRNRRRLGPVARAHGFQRCRNGPLPERPTRRKHHESDEPRARRGARLFRPGVSPIHAAAGDARLLARVPGDQPFPDRALGGAGIGTQLVSLLNDQSHPAAPCERRDPQ